MKANGLILWTGKSLYDGVTDIAVILTGLKSSSANAKTGDMLQTWIIAVDGKPHERVKQGADSAICGTCPLSKGNGCYVRTEHAPLAVHRKLHSVNSYPVYNPAEHDELLRGRLIRFGSYGDPAAVPLHVWENLARLASAYTGYTHGWRERPDLAPYCMASVHNLAEAAAAQALGFRTFRTLPTSDTETARKMTAPNEIVCPEKTKGISCEQCRLCIGNGNGAKNIAMPVHGARSVKVIEVSEPKPSTGTAY